MNLVFRSFKAIEGILNVVLIALQFWKKILFNLSILENISVLLNAFQLMYNILLCTCAKLKNRTLLYCEFFLLVICILYCINSYRIIADKGNLYSVASVYWIETGFNFVLFLLQLWLVLYMLFRHLRKNSTEYEQRTPSLSNSNCSSSEDFSSLDNAAALLNSLRVEVQDLVLNKEHSEFRNCSSVAPMLKKRSDMNLGLLFRPCPLESQEEETSLTECNYLPSSILPEATINLTANKNRNELGDPRKSLYSIPKLEKTDTKISKFQNIDCSTNKRRCSLKFKCSETLSDNRIGNPESSREAAVLDDKIDQNKKSSEKELSDKQIDQNVELSKLCELSKDILERRLRINRMASKMNLNNLHTAYSKYYSTRCIDSTTESDEEIKLQNIRNKTDRVSSNQISGHQLCNKNTVNSHPQLLKTKQELFVEKMKMNRSTRLRKTIIEDSVARVSNDCQRDTLRNICEVNLCRARTGTRPERTKIQNESTSFSRDKSNIIRKSTPNNLQPDGSSSINLDTGSTCNSIGSDYIGRACAYANINFKNENSSKTSNKSYSIKMSGGQPSCKSFLKQEELTPMLYYEPKTSKNILEQSNSTNVKFQNAKEFMNVCHKGSEISNISKNCIKEHQTSVKTEHDPKRNSNTNKNPQAVPDSNISLKKKINEGDSLDESISDIEETKALKEDENFVKTTPDDQNVEKSEK